MAVLPQTWRAQGGGRDGLGPVVTLVTASKPA
jgi:hypothetical protein